MHFPADGLCRAQPATMSSTQTHQDQHKPHRQHTWKHHIPNPMPAHSSFWCPKPLFLLHSREETARVTPGGPPYQKGPFHLTTLPIIQPLSESCKTNSHSPSYALFTHYYTLLLLTQSYRRPTVVLSTELTRSERHSHLPAPPTLISPDFPNCPHMALPPPPGASSSGSAQV